jgi:hypothetical protein
MAGMMAPAILVTVGVLFLLDNLLDGSFEFGRTMPLILIVIGIVKVLQHTAPTEGHVPPYGYVPGQVPPPPAAVAPVSNPDQEAPHV